MYGTGGQGPQISEQENPEVAAASGLHGAGAQAQWNRLENPGTGVAPERLCRQNVSMWKDQRR